MGWVPKCLSHQDALTDVQHDLPTKVSVTLIFGDMRSAL